MTSVYLCDGRHSYAGSFSSLRPKLVGTQAEFEKAFLASTPRTLWVSPRADELFRFAVAMAGRRGFRRRPERRSRPMLLSLNKIEDSHSLLVYSLFGPVVEAGGKTFLPDEQLAEALSCARAGEIAIGGSVDCKTQTLILVRGDLTPLVVPFSALKNSGDGIAPDFDALAIVDSGQTVRLGRYEAAMDALLYEFDADYRKEQRKKLLAVEKSFGASLRRLRLQKGLSQSDFPGITVKEIGRIERGEVKCPRAGTLTRLAKALGVASGQIETF